MIAAGCDIGSLSAKAVILENGGILASAMMPAGTSPPESARAVMDKASEAAGIARESVKNVIATGYGKDLVSFASDVESEIVCHAKGAFWVNPKTRTIIDIGGQDSKVIRLDENGKVVRYFYNDKCASGTGRFLEVMAEALEVDLEDMGALSEQSCNELVISNQCVIFAETEVVSLINDGKHVPDIIAALHRAMAGRVAAMAIGIGVEDEVVMTGGVAKNSGLYSALCGALKKELAPIDGIDPQITGALGAALIAAGRL
ncbi:MAG: acyl-CoA dehydratase activase [Thermodesulfobacteriota bacterium]